MFNLQKSLDAHKKALQEIGSDLKSNRKPKRRSLSLINVAMLIHIGSVGLVI